ncbi:hypothetical protein EUGRSUZ_F00661 [Eucalyptus grandis]|uniref:Uncharacterized protein n=2 Tax=Eucalyptus grandis TaxID=71139 RepID=A0ACC3KC21_EUCGR|nr:hypothetical protein EUGRSUZ_F00661 [Eucalyptus grandis]
MARSGTAGAPGAGVADRAGPALGGSASAEAPGSRAQGFGGSVESRERVKGSVGPRLLGDGRCSVGRSGGSQRASAGRRLRSR